ncbi:HPP family protein [Xylariaceae sp. FL0662B]|nr:HPP family protein [Xylariaceae sp. FL0662B]
MPSFRSLDFDIDKYLNRLIPSPPWKSIPYPVAYFLGHRTDAVKEHGNILTVFWGFIGVFCSLALIQVISRQIPAVATHGPRVVASFGAAAVLEFYAIDSPLAQPRNAILSQIIASVVGVSCSKLFQLSPHFESIRLFAGALSCAAVVALMGLTKTVHPPAGATALLAVADDAAVTLGWTLVLLIILGCAIMLCTALILNNIQRRFPVYWWTPEDLTGLPSTQEGEPSSSGEEGKASYEGSKLVITRSRIIVPDHMILAPEEKFMLESLCNRI